MSITRNAIVTLLIASIAGLAAPARAQCVGDIIPDGQVDGIDLGVLLGYWGPRTSAAFSIASDLNQDGFVDGTDLGFLLNGWGSCPVITPSWATLVEAVPDPLVVTDPALRQQIAETRLAWRVRDTSTQVEMLLVPPGTFQMGCVMGSNQYGCISWELPVHQVTLTSAYYMGRYELTQAQWQERMGTNPSFFQSPSAQVPAQEVPNRPVEQVSWDTIQGYLNATGMRLPTGAEWERACRAGTQTPFYNGSTDDGTLADLGWYSANADGQTHPVGGKAANALGFHDMLGNVWEMVSGWAGTYPSTPQTNPTGPANGTDRQGYGGSWFHGSDRVRSSSRGSATPSETFTRVGFRVARSP